MKGEKHTSNSQIRFIRVVLIYIIPVLSMSHAIAQEDSAHSYSDISVGDSIYIITNRQVDTTSTSLTFNNEIDDDNGLSFVKVKRDTTLTLSSETLSHDAFIAQVSSKASDWLLFVHGDSKTYNQSIQRGFDIQNLYNINVIVFSWPSKNLELTGLKNLNNSKRNLQKSMVHFNEVLACMDSCKKRNNDLKKNPSMSMLLHSLGNLYLENLANEPAVAGKYNNLFENVIINSAAVEQKAHKDWVELMSFQQRIYITNNRSDFNLKGKHIFSKDGNQLGEKAKTPNAENAYYVEFSKAVGFRFPTGTTHTYFIGNIPSESQNIHDFYNDVLHGIQIDFSNPTQFIKQRKGVGYEVIF